MYIMGITWNKAYLWSLLPPLNTFNVVNYFNNRFWSNYIHRQIVYAPSYIVLFIYTDIWLFLIVSDGYSKMITRIRKNVRMQTLTTVCTLQETHHSAQRAVGQRVRQLLSRCIITVTHPVELGQRMNLHHTSDR